MEQLKVQSPLPENTEGKFQYYTCPQCNGDWSRLEASEICWDCEQKNETKKRIEKNRLDFFTKNLGKKGYEEYTFERFKPIPGTEEALKACQEFDPTKDNLFIYGPCGTGKSHLSGATWRKWAENLRRGGIYRQPDIMRDFRLRDPDEETALLKAFEKMPILVIDDMGVGKATEFANQILYEIIERRTMNCQNGLIITSNLSLDDIATKMGDDRLPSRIMGLCKRIKIGSERDMRIETVH